METVRNAATAASKVIWGEQPTTQTNETTGQEPISGQQGKGTVDQPYDQGNAENPTNSSTDPTPSSTTESTSVPKAAESTPTTTATTEIPDTTMSPDSAATAGASKPLENTEKTGITSEPSDTPKASDVVPSSASLNPGAAPSSGAAPTEKQQGADRPNDDPTDVDPEEILKKRDPNDHSGEPMRMHDGSEKTVPSTQEERRDSKIGMPGGQEHGSEPKGTGEQWVKTSGLAADGGDFDATKPGAGREAERLLEEKGIHKTDPNKAAEGPMTTGSSSEEKVKVPLSEKIKTKLHIGHKEK